MCLGTQLLPPMRCEKHVENVQLEPAFEGAFHTQVIRNSVILKLTPQPPLNNVIPWQVEQVNLRRVHGMKNRVMKYE